MSTNHQRTATWLQACGKMPGAENLSTQLGCHIEEICEFLSMVWIVGDSEAERSLMHSVDNLQDLAAAIKQRRLTADLPPSVKGRVDALDALCDCEVTGNGVAYLAGMDKPGADEVVLASNEAKLVDGKPVILPGGKIGKPPGWTAPDLTPFVQAPWLLTKQAA